MIILGIETSCDETAAALVEARGDRFNILSNVVSSQIEIHKKYGGVVPEVAARNHLINMLPVIDEAFNIAKIKPEKIDRIAVTTGPGLITSLIVGEETAKALSYAWKKPLVPVNHMKAHLYANWANNTKIKYPALALIVSGGHTELVLVKNKTNFKKIGQTVDDAAGEAFDKVAQLLELGYPGGPIISKLALEGDSRKFDFARPMINSQNFNFSFSGLKTSVLYTVKKLTSKQVSKQQADICASFQQAVVDVLVSKTIGAAKKYKVKTIMLSGGVAANKHLRETLGGETKELGIDYLVPDFFLCTDNATMIAVAGYFEKPMDIRKIKVDPNLDIG